MKTFNTTNPSTVLTSGYHAPPPFTVTSGSTCMWPQVGNRHWLVRRQVQNWMLTKVSSLNASTRQFPRSLLWTLEKVLCLTWRRLPSGFCGSGPSYFKLGSFRYYFSAGGTTDGKHTSSGFFASAYVLLLLHPFFHGGWKTVLWCVTAVIFSCVIVIGEGIKKKKKCIYLFILLCTSKTSICFDLFYLLHNFENLFRHCKN